MANYNGNSYLLKLYVEEAMDKKGHEVFSRAYTLKNVQAVQIGAEKTGAAQSSVLSNEGGLTAGKAPARISVAELVDLVKGNDKEFTYNSSSKVVNEDGTPKVVYHGTNADFSTFQSKGGTYWFSESQDYAEAMAEERGGTRVEGYYLNLRNPYRATLPANQFSNPNYEAAIIRKAKAGGYDGAIIQNDTDSEYAKDTFYVAFSPNQIKSDEYNVGTFDKNNPDIRYSLNDDDTDLPGMDEQRDSKFSQFSDTYENGTHIVGKSQSVQIATELKKEYSSSVNTQELATKYRQMSSVAERLAELNFEMVTDGGASTGDIGAEYTQVHRQLMEMGREVADTIIDNASVRDHGDSTVYDYLKNKLRGEKIYIPDSIAEGKMTMEESIQFATEDMLYQTFQDDTLIGSLLNGLHDLGNAIGTGKARSETATSKTAKRVKDFGLGDLVIKYRGVPGALVTRAIEFSPAGYLKALYNGVQLAQSKGTNTHAQRNVALAFSRATTGSGLIALFWLLGGHSQRHFADVPGGRHLSGDPGADRRQSFRQNRMAGADSGAHQHFRRRDYRQHFQDVSDPRRLFYGR